MLFTRLLGRHVLLSLFCGSACLPGQGAEPDPVSPEADDSPLRAYLSRNLIPAPNSISVRQQSTGGSSRLTSATRTITAAGEVEIDLTKAGRLVNERVIISNSGDVPIVNPWVVANNRRNWFSCDSIVQEALRGETDPELKAFRIWNVVRRGRYHWYPAEAGLEVHSPVKFLNVYGYGFCDDSATILELLWRLSGFPNSRCYGLGGHVVSEVQYGGGWRVLDADLEMFYPLHNGPAAGVQQLASNGSLVGRLTPDFEELYTSKADNTPYVGWWDSDSSMVMTLRPDESLERCHYNWGKFHDNLYHKQPPFYGNGRQIWRPDLKTPARSLPGFRDLTNLSWTASSEDASDPLIRPTDPDQPALLVWTMTSAYVFVGGTIDLDLYATGPAASAEVHFRKPGQEWQHLATISGTHDGLASISLDAAIAPLSSDACYSFDLKLLLRAGSGGQSSRIGLNALSTTGEVQCNPRSLPALISGRANQIVTTFSPAQDAQLDVTFEWSQQDDLPPLIPPSAPIAPADGSIITTTAPELKWESVQGDNPNLRREVMVSLDPKGQRPAAPLSWVKGPRSNSWIVPDGTLAAGRTYYWRVREGSLPSDWSPTWSFTIQGSPGATSPREESTR